MSIYEVCFRKCDGKGTITHTKTINRIVAMKIAKDIFETDPAITMCWVFFTSSGAAIGNVYTRDRMTQGT
jgi:S-adenosylmethionine synthetase